MRQKLEGAMARGSRPAPSCLLAPRPAVGPRPVSIALCRRPCTTAGPGDPWWSRGCVAVQ
jgi:hypothetical protein